MFETAEKKKSFYWVTRVSTLKWWNSNLYLNCTHMFHISQKVIIVRTRFVRPENRNHVLKGSFPLPKRYVGLIFMIKGLNLWYLLSISYHSTWHDKLFNKLPHTENHPFQLWLLLSSIAKNTHSVELLARDQGSNLDPLFLHVW